MENNIMSKNELPRLTPPELEIMDTVWQAGELTLTGILNAVNAAGQKNLKRATIQMEVSRLEKKGWIIHRGEGNKFLFKAAIPRREASTAIVRDVRKRVFGGSCVELVSALFSDPSVPPEEIGKLRELLEKYKGR